MRYPSVLSGGRIIVFRRCLMSEPPHLVEESVIDNALIFKKKADSLWSIPAKDSTLLDSFSAY